MIAVLLLALALPLQGGGVGPGQDSGSFSDSDSLPVPDSFIVSALERQPAAPPGSSAFVRFDLNFDQTQSFVVRAFGLPAGTYEVVRIRLQDEFSLGSLDVGADGMGKLWPQAPAVGDFLDWFAEADTLEVRAGVDVLHSAYLDPFGIVIWLGEPPSLVDGARLIAVGDDLDARGRLVYRAEGDTASLDLRLERVAPGPYILEVDGQPALYVEAGKGGKASMVLSRPIQAGTGRLTLNPVGEPVRVLDAAGDVVFAAQMPVLAYGSQNRPPGRQKFRDVGEGAADGLRVDFVKGGNYSSPYLKRGSVAWHRDALGAAGITLEVLGKWDFFSETYGLFVGDTWVGDLVLPADDGFQPVAATFAAPPELDLRGQRVELRGGALVHLALVFPQSVPAGVRTYRADVRKPHRLRLDLLNPGTDLDATGRLDWRLHKGVEELQLVVRDLPAGAYDVVLDGLVVVAGALLVGEDGGEAGQLFSTGGIVAGSLPLEFAVHGALEIRATGAEATFLRQDLGD